MFNSTSSVFYLTNIFCKALLLELQLCTKQSSRIACPSRVSDMHLTDRCELVTEMQAEEERAHGQSLYKFPKHLSPSCDGLVGITIELRAEGLVFTRARAVGGMRGEQGVIVSPCHRAGGNAHLCGGEGVA